MSNLILASASPRRKEILTLMGLQFTVKPSQCEEIISETIPDKIVMELSRQKAEDVSLTANSGDLVIGSDTIVVLDNSSLNNAATDKHYQILGKPKSRAQGFEMLRSMAGRTHYVYTGVTIIRVCPEQNKILSFAECTEVHVAQMSDEEINAYLDTNEYTDKAGGYGIQGRFAPYITGINGDYYNVMGLPAAALYQKLKEI